MKTLRAALQHVLPATAMMASLILVSQAAIAQTATPPNNSAVQQQTRQPDDANAASEAKTFTGKIVKDGGKLVLTDADGKMTYQLDDQKKAKAFLNKSVKVTGVLDNSSGMIRINAIEPAA